MQEDQIGGSGIDLFGSFHVIAIFVALCSWHKFLCSEKELYFLVASCNAAVDKQRCYKREIQYSVVNKMLFFIAL